jgi:polysaccharide export outer membrane protein
VSVALSADEILIDILEYRPVYLRGDVSRPGEQPFRPGMTVRQAIAVSGGYDFIRFRSGNPIEQAAQLRGENTSLWSEIVSKQAIVARLRAETDGGAFKMPAKSEYEQSPLAPEVVAAAFKMEQDQLASRRAERDRESTYLKSVISQSDRRISLLTEQLKNEQEGSKQDIEDFERVSKLFEKGNTSITRFSDSRRSMLLSATRILQTSAAVAQVEREREEFKKLLADIDDKRKVEALKELQDAETKLQQAKAKVVATQEQLLYTGKMRSQLGMTAASKAEIVIVRDNDKTRERIPAQEDNELWPGDVVEVALDARELLGYLPN